MAVQIKVDKGCLVVATDQSLITEEEAKNCVDALKSHHVEPRAWVIFDFTKIKEVSLPALRILTRAVSGFSQSETKVAVIALKGVSDFIKEQGLERLFPCYATLTEIFGEASDPSGLKQRTAEFLSTTLEAVTYTLQVSTNTVVKAGQSYTRGQGPMTKVDTAAVVGLFSSIFNGALVIGFPTKTYLALMSRMLAQEYKEMCPEIQDGAAEILNIILGQVKSILNQKGYAIKQAIPAIAQGSQLQILPSTSRPSLIVPYTSDVGDFYFELTMISDGK